MQNVEISLQFRCKRVVLMLYIVVFDLTKFLLHSSVQRCLNASPKAYQNLRASNKKATARKVGFYNSCMTLPLPRSNAFTTSRNLELFRWLIAITDMDKGVVPLTSLPLACLAMPRQVLAKHLPSANA